MSSEIYNYFMSQGWSAPQSAGIVGNLFGESGLNAGAIGDGGAAYGIAQWHPDRQANFQRVMGIPIQGSTALQQAQFVNWELNNTEKKAGGLLRKAGNVIDATKAFMFGYERPANGSSLGSRIAAASSVLNGKTIGTAIRAGAAVATGGLSEVGLEAANLVGLGPDSCGPVCQFRKWLDESHFWQRLAIGVMALLILIVALWMLGNKMNINVGKSA